MTKYTRLAYVLLIALAAFGLYNQRRIDKLETRVSALETDRLHLLSFHEREAAILQGQGAVLLTLGMDYADRQGIKKGPRFPLAQVDEETQGTKRLISPPPSSVSPR